MYVCMCVYVGATALHVIAGRNQARMAALLLQLGADPDAKDEDGVSPATGTLLSHSYAMILCIDLCMCMWQVSKAINV